MRTQAAAKGFPILLMPMFMLGIAMPVSGQHQERAITLTSSADIAAASSVDMALNSLIAQAASCKTPGMVCACSLKSGLGRLSAAYHSAINGHPGWKEAVVQYVVQANGRSVTTAIVFPNVRRQLDLCHRP